MPAGGWFVGRNAELSQLQIDVSDGGALIGHVICGLGGVGKSELALRYAFAQLPRHEVTWWINAENRESLADGIEGLGRRLGLQSTVVNEYDRAVLWLQSHTGWLVILDNVEDPRTVIELLGAVQDRGHVLVTTRRDLGTAVWARYRLAPLRLGVLDRASSVELLEKLTLRVHERQDVEQLAADLGDLPIAIEQAGSYIGQRKLTVAEYRNRLAIQPSATYQAAAAGTDAGRVMSRVWEVTMKAVSVQSPLAREVAAVLAWMAPDALPIEVLDGLVLCGYAIDSTAVEDAVMLLTSYSMLTAADGLITVHRLVQAVTRAHDNDQVQHRHVAAHLLALAAPEDSEAGDLWRQLMPHVAMVASRTPLHEHSPGLLDVMLRARTLGQGRWMKRLMAFTIAIYLDRLTNESQLFLDVTRPDAASQSTGDGSIEHGVGRVTDSKLIEDWLSSPQARDLLSTAENDWASTATPVDWQTMVDMLSVGQPGIARWEFASDPEIRKMRASLALAYLRAGQVGKAVQLLKLNTDTRLRMNGYADPWTSAGREALAGTYRSVGLVGHAARLYTQFAIESRPMRRALSANPC